ncbi:MAG: hypothetical protein IJA55_03575 [Clostridia bacterium]|nr:hypothetical protein [Clostridia bacterium]
MEATAWDIWINRINNSSVDDIDTEILCLEKTNMPYVEKNLKLGYLYYSKDFLGTATNIFKSLSKKISSERTNFEFIKENEQGLNILYMGFRLEPDGCGGFEIIETGCGADCCGPVCGCIGIAAVMACCGINSDDITTCDTEDGQGCLDNGINSCCNCGEYWCGDGNPNSIC